ncbi:MAG: restriction endonuclease [Nitrososphaeria archaeon]
MNINSKTLLKVLPYLKDNHVDVPSISKDTGIPQQTILEILGPLIEEGYIEDVGGRYQGHKGAMIYLAIEAVKAGAAFEEVLKNVRWQDFESFVEIVLTEYGYKTFKNYRLKKPKIEVDIFARKQRFALLIDCKQWHKTLGSSDLETIIRKQIDRARTLLIYDGRLPKNIILIPVVISLFPSYVRCFEGVPVVGCDTLKSFVSEVEGRMDEFIKLMLEDGSVTAKV